MKAWQVSKHGGPEVLEWVDLPEPKPGPLEVIVKVRAVGLNHLDLWVRTGVEGHRFPLPMVPGCDVVGEVESFGIGSEKPLEASGIKVGTRVLINPGISCGRCKACLGGFDPLCKSYGIFGETQNGGCAERLSVPVTNLIALAETITDAEAACLPIPFLTAWAMLVDKGKVKPNDVVLVHAGGSAVSVAAIQIAKLFGAFVLTTVGSEEKVEKAKSLGADAVIEYRKKPFRAEVKRILADLGNGQKGCDIVIDHIGRETFNESLKCLNWGGKLILCGATSGSEVTIDLKAVFFKNISILGSTMGSKADLLSLVDLVSRQKLKAVVDSVFPWKKLKEAQARIAERKTFGKVILLF